ncbi:TPA: tail fiber domain-containing protein [Klebsiella pneumoniae]|uniref:tail fiber domain-containing protein n=1 Tax=Klebsiella pneumoniae TaxID=573 RepID=UPI001F3BE896|nr:tail fiber domain-containing protein [Klebsiella pneumoniae]MCF1380214.1 tail fiber domain-containing protein [Klebsiella pneumoniae]MCF2235210.1 tail fiber domain-containing protein [Klebsiella pneumoniae]MDV5335271.1 tail fiber domain-containing protein [Klebsiella pneumoniae]MDV5340642.1 tail fiber domain-containing protein [Klebsiella pneumoniae]MDV5361465.1 tail fiber domain-containing protein [Klebsiella pneumoniae]
MSMYEVGTVAGAANQAKVTGTTTKWSNAALGVQQGSILVVYRSGNADLYAIKSVDSDTQLTLSRNITVAFSGASYGIITSETASTSAFANQLASAFSLWRSVVEGWSAALTSTGNITMTDPITGVSVTVPAINGMARIAGGNNLTGTQSLDSDDSGFILGMNGDIGLIKKSGTYGKVMVGKSSRFSVVRSDKDRISATDEQTEIFGVEANGDVKVANSLYAKGVLQSDYQVKAQSIELSSSTPYIDFHHNNSTDDYTHRIITEDGALAVMPGLRVRGGLGIYGTSTSYGGPYSDGMIAKLENDPPNVPVGSILPSPRFIARFNTRGSDSNVNGAQASMWFEEHVGTTHRLVLMCAGFGANVQYWQFDAGGNINSSTRGGVQFLGTSDARLKHDITPTDGQQSVDRIKALELVTFVYNDDEQNRTRRGIIAQQAQKVDPQYVKQVNTSYMRNGEQVNDDRLQLDNNVIMMDTLAAVKVLIKRVDELEERLNKIPE